jgi:hypothetical protein
MVKACPDLATIDLENVTLLRMEDLARMRAEWPDLRARNVRLRSVPSNIGQGEVEDPRGLLRLFTFADGKDFWQEPDREDAAEMDPGVRLFD